MVAFAFLLVLLASLPHACVTYDIRSDFMQKRHVAVELTTRHFASNLSSQSLQNAGFFAPGVTYEMGWLQNGAPRYEPRIEIPVQSVIPVIYLATQDEPPTSASNDLFVVEPFPDLFSTFISPAGLNGRWHILRIEGAQLAGLDSAHTKVALDVSRRKLPSWKPYDPENFEKPAYIFVKRFYEQTSILNPSKYVHAEVVVCSKEEIGSEPLAKLLDDLVDEDGGLQKKKHAVEIGKYYEDDGRLIYIPASGRLQKGEFRHMTSSEETCRAITLSERVKITSPVITPTHLFGIKPAVDSKIVRPQMNLFFFGKSTFNKVFLKQVDEGSEEVIVKLEPPGCDQWHPNDLDASKPWSHHHNKFASWLLVCNFGQDGRIPTSFTGLHSLNTITSPDMCTCENWVREKRAYEHDLERFTQTYPTAAEAYRKFAADAFLDPGDKISNATYIETLELPMNELRKNLVKLGEGTVQRSLRLLPDKRVHNRNMTCETKYQMKKDLESDRVSEQRARLELQQEHEKLAEASVESKKESATKIDELEARIALFEERRRAREEEMMLPEALSIWNLATSIRAIDGHVVHDWGNMGSSIAGNSAQDVSLTLLSEQLISNVVKAAIGSNFAEFMQVEEIVCCLEEGSFERIWFADFNIVRSKTPHVFFSDWPAYRAYKFLLRLCQNFKDKLEAYANKIWDSQSQSLITGKPSPYRPRCPGMPNITAERWWLRYPGTAHVAIVPAAEKALRQMYAITSDMSDMFLRVIARRKQVSRVDSDVVAHEVSNNTKSHGHNGSHVSADGLHDTLSALDFFGRVASLFKDILE